MVKDEEITFNGEETAHPGRTRIYICSLLSVTVWVWQGGGTVIMSMSALAAFILEDCTDCFGAQKKDEPNDKDKKEEEETSTSVHHSIIETWDWGRQPGESRPDECGAAAPGQPAVTLVLLHLLLSKWGN